jgi:hypothetical protein
MVEHNTEPTTLVSLSASHPLTGSTDPGGQRPPGRPADSASGEFRFFIHGLEAVGTEIARRVESAYPDEFAGLSEVVETVVVYAAPAKRHVYGWYGPEMWHDRRSGQRFGEIVVNADLLDLGAAELLETLAHELAHAWAKATDQRDTSRNGHYHNRLFAEIALKFGLIVDRHRTRGHATTGISPLGHALYGDLLEALDTLLRLHRHPHPDDDGPDPGGASGTPGPAGAGDDAERPPTKYVMATCGCVNDRRRPVVIRVARGNWQPDTIWCRRCDQCFTNPDGELSETPQPPMAA